MNLLTRQGCAAEGLEDLYHKLGSYTITNRVLFQNRVSRWLLSVTNLSIYEVNIDHHRGPTVYQDHTRNPVRTF